MKCRKYIRPTIRRFAFIFSLFLNDIAKQVSEYVKLLDWS